MSDEEYKIHYNKDGWVCERCPNYIEVDGDCTEITVNKEVYEKTLMVEMGKHWRYVNGEFKVEPYGDIPIYIQIDVLKNNLRKTDYQTIKFAEGQLTEEEFAPIRTQRQLWRDEINRLESLNNNTESQ